MAKSRNILTFFLTILLCSYLLPWSSFAAVNPGTASPQYSYTSAVRCSLSISTNGVASCKGNIRAKNDTSKVSIKLRLLRKNGTSWTPVKTWEKSDQLSYGSLDKDCSVSAGTYKLVVSGSVTTTEGRTEFVSASTSEKVYSNGSGGT